MGIGYLPQEASVFRRMSVEDNILAIPADYEDLISGEKRAPEKLINETGLTQVKEEYGISVKRRGKKKNRNCEGPRYKS